MGFDLSSGAAGVEAFQNQQGILRRNKIEDARISREQESYDYTKSRRPMQEEADALAMKAARRKEDRATREDDHNIFVDDLDKRLNRFSFTGDPTEIADLNSQLSQDKDPWSAVGNDDGSFDATNGTDTRHYDSRDAVIRDMLYMRDPKFRQEMIKAGDKAKAALKKSIASGKGANSQAKAMTKAYMDLENAKGIGNQKTPEEKLKIMINVGRFNGLTPEQTKKLMGVMAENLPEANPNTDEGASLSTSTYAKAYGHAFAKFSNEAVSAVGAAISGLLSGGPLVKGMPPGSASAKGGPKKRAVPGAAIAAEASPDMAGIIDRMDVDFLTELSAEANKASKPLDAYLSELIDEEVAGGANRDDIIAQLTGGAQ